MSESVRFRFVALRSLFGRVAFARVLTLGVAVSCLSAPASAQTHGGPLSGAHFSLLGLGLAAAVGLVLAIAIGYSVHSIIGDRALGLNLNCVAAAVGAWSALAIFDWRGLDIVASDVGVMILGAFALLAAAIGTKEHAIGETGEALPWRRPKVSTAYKRVLDPPPRGPPMHRLEAALRPRRAAMVHEDLNEVAPEATPTSNEVAPDPSLVPSPLESSR